MTLSELLEPELILTKVACASKDELISTLLGKLYSAGKNLPVSQKELLHTVHKREQIGGTVLPSGLSVPHARIEDFEDFILVLGIPVEPLPHDGFQIKMMSLMVSNLSGGLYYLPSLAALTKISRDTELFSLLCGAENPEIFIRLIKDRDSELA